MKWIAWLAALALLLIAPSALGQEAPYKESVLPPRTAFMVDPMICPALIREFDRDGDGQTDKMEVVLDLECAARVREALKDSTERQAPQPPARRQRGARDL